MARKNILAPSDMLTGQPVNPITQDVTSHSLAADFNTLSTAVPYMDNVAIQIVITTSDSTGSFFVQASMDNVNWADLTLSGTPAAAGADDVINISLNQVPFYYLRCRYAHSVAGTGTATFQLMTKQVGG